MVRNATGLRTRRKYRETQFPVQQWVMDDGFIGDRARATGRQGDRAVSVDEEVFPTSQPLLNHDFSGDWRMAGFVDRNGNGVNRPIIYRVGNIAGPRLIDSSRLAPLVPMRLSSGFAES